MSMSANYHIDREDGTAFRVSHHERNQGADFFVISLGFWPVPNDLCIFVNRDQLEELARVVNAALKAHPAPSDPDNGNDEGGNLPRQT